MPHLVLRHSANLPETDFKPFFIQVHELLANTINVKISSCSSMVIAHEQYVISSGDTDQAFVHLDITVKPGKLPESVHLASKGTLELLKNHVTQSNTKISVSIAEVSPYFYS